MSYEYWNAFIEDWRTGGPLFAFPHLHGWAHPGEFQLMNRTGHIDASINYIPEPWWGNNGYHPLHSVVINYNPGSALQVQHFNQAQGLNGFNNYQDFANNEAIGNTAVFIRTNNWHLTERAMPIYSSLQINGLGLRNHLSIELIPWHTQRAREINNYIFAHLTTVYESSIKFAAAESRRIANPILKNKVLLRISGNNCRRLLAGFAEAGICTYDCEDDVVCPNGDGLFMRFHIPEIHDIVFIAIWSRTRRNRLPQQPFLDWIINAI